MLCAVARFISPWDAHCVRGRLEAEGVPAYLHGEHHISVNRPLSLALGGVQLMVDADNRRRATEIVEACTRGAYENDIPDHAVAAEQCRCPACGSSEVTTQWRWPSLLLALAMLGIAVTYPVRRTRYRCSAGGNAWSERRLGAYRPSTMRSMLRPYANLRPLTAATLCREALNCPVSQVYPMRPPGPSFDTSGRSERRGERVRAEVRR